MVLSSIAFFIEVIIQILRAPEEDEHLATCFGPKEATLGKKAQRANVLVLHENRSVTRHGVE